jgi:hypothetical protein
MTSSRQDAPFISRTKFAGDVAAAGAEVTIA